MAPFVGEGEKVTQNVFFVVHKDIRFTRVRTRGEGAGAFALIFVAVDPAAEESLAYDRAVLFSQGRKCADDGFHRLFVGVVCFYLSDYRSVGVPVGELLHSQSLSAYVVVAVEEGQVIVYGGNEVVVNLDGYLVGEERFFPCGGKLLYPGQVDVLLNASVVEGRKAVLVAVIDTVELTVRLFPDGTVRVDEEGAEGGLT